MSSPILKIFRQLWPGMKLPRNFPPLFPNRWLTTKEAQEMVGGEKEFYRLRSNYPDILIQYKRGEQGTAFRYSLWDIQDAMQEDERNQREQYLTKNPRGI